MLIILWMSYVLHHHLMGLLTAAETVLQQKNGQNSTSLISKFTIQMQEGHHVAIIQHGKGDKRRTVKLPVDVFRAIQTSIESTCRAGAAPTSPLFTGFVKGGRPTVQGISDKLIERVVKQYATVIGVDTLTPHGLRASFITLALENKASLHQVQYAAGHADPRTTERYHTRKLNLDDNAVDYIKL